MIGRKALARACRENDALADDGETKASLLPELGFEPDDVDYVAIQRALRMYAVFKGTNALKLRLADIPAEDRLLIQGFAAAWIDGLATASLALDIEQDSPNR